MHPQLEVLPFSHLQEFQHTIITLCQLGMFAWTLQHLRRIYVKKVKIIHFWIPPKLETDSNNFVFFPFRTKKKTRTSLISLSFPGKKQDPLNPLLIPPDKQQPNLNQIQIPDGGDISHGHHSRILQRFPSSQKPCLLSLEIDLSDFGNNYHMFHYL